MDIHAVIYLLEGMMCSAAMALILRHFRNSRNNRYGMLAGNYLTCAMIGFLLLEDRSLISHAQISTYICGLLGGILFVVSLVCMQTSIGKSGAILTSAFSKLGLLVPIITSILFFHERPAGFQNVGLVLVLAAMWIFSHDKTDHPQNFNMPLLLAVLLTNGMADGMARIYSHFGVRSQDSLYIFFVFLTALVITFVLLLKEYRKTGKAASGKDLLVGILVGIPNYFSSILLLKALDGIPAFIAYPVFSAGAILIVATFSFFFYREKLTQRQLYGLGLILISIILLNLQTG